MQFKFVGEDPSDAFGFMWYPGTVHDVTDDHAIRKLSNSVYFEAVGSPEPAPVDDMPEDKFEDYVKQPKRRGRPPNAVKVEDGDQN
ncbi:MAG: hypothetical protein CTY28_10165 [Hyphomicrobium sp.]|nr:MAG: hypothetical protein CTY28_10165 [Hyphomicrobium sp.]